MHVSAPLLPLNAAPALSTPTTTGAARPHTHPTLRIQFRNDMLQHQEQHLSLRTRIWRAVCLYAFKKWGHAYKGHPIGVPGERDPLFPCSAYQPRPRNDGNASLCETDYHYLCHNCAENRHNAPRQKAVME